MAGQFFNSQSINFTYFFEIFHINVLIGNVLGALPPWENRPEGDDVLHRP